MRRGTDAKFFKRASASKSPPDVFQSEKTDQASNQRDRQVALKGKTKKRGVCGDQHHNRE